MRKSQCALWPFTQGKMQAWLDIGVTGPLQASISVTVPVRKKVSTDRPDHLYETTYRGKNDHGQSNDHVTDDVT